MKIVFEQKKPLQYRIHTLLKDRIIVESKSYGTVDKYEVKLDKIGLDLQYKRESLLERNILIAGGLLFLIISTVSYLMKAEFLFIQLMVIYFSVGVIILVMLLKEKVDHIFLVGETTLSFFRTVPSEEAVMQFIEKVKAQVKQYYREKYLTFDDDESEHLVLHRLDWLKESEFISQEEYDFFKSDYKTNRLL